VSYQNFPFDCRSYSDRRLLIDDKIRTGYGAHGDYLFGWKEGALQRAMDALGTNCFSETCPVLKLQSSEEAIGCTKGQQAVEDTGTDTCEYTIIVILD
jgi:hypothetical protein